MKRLGEIIPPIDTSVIEVECHKPSPYLLLENGQKRGQPFVSNKSISGWLNAPTKPHKNAVRLTKM